MKNKFNSIYLGLAIGICLPLIALVIFYLSHKDDFGFNDILKSFSIGDVYSVIKKDLLTKVISLCAILNLLAFFGFLQINRLLSARGIIIATFIYVGLVLILKFLV